jgi:hypothetical protein
MCLPPFPEQSQNIRLLLIHQADTWKFVSSYSPGIIHENYYSSWNYSQIPLFIPELFITTLLKMPTQFRIITAALWRFLASAFNIGQWPHSGLPYPHWVLRTTPTYYVLLAINLFQFSNASALCGVSFLFPYHSTFILNPLTTILQQHVVLGVDTRLRNLLLILCVHSLQ